MYEKIIKMALVNTLSSVGYKPLNRWDYSSFQPGPVGSVGDTLGTVRLKHSFPDQGIRLEPSLKRNKQNRLGSNVSDGNATSFTTGGRGDPFVINSPWTDTRIRKTSYGEIFQDVRAPDKLHEPRLGSLPQLSWNNKIATVYNAKRTGNMFLPIPGPYVLSPGEVTRGAQVPLVTSVTQPQQTTNMIYDLPHPALTTPSGRTLAPATNIK